MDEYGLYAMLEHKVVDRFLEHKISGETHTNTSILDQSHNWSLITTRAVSPLRDLWCKVEKEPLKEKVHWLRFEVWHKSVRSRTRVNAIATSVLTLIFTIYLYKFNSQLHTVIDETTHIKRLQTDITGIQGA